MTARAGWLRTVLALARVEAFWLGRSPLILAGLLGGGTAVFLIIIQSAEPLWWHVGWMIGFGQLVLGMAVLVTAQLAAGRARRDAMGDLYASFPATAATRTLAHLAGVAAAAPESLLLIGASVALVDALGPIGAPDIAVLAGGLLLVIAAGAAGVAIGSRFPHPLAGVAGALALLLSSETSHVASGAAIWLVPWQEGQDQLGNLPGPLPGYPPAGAHALELGGLAVLAGIVALAVTVSRARARAWLAAAGVVAMAVIYSSGALQLRPIPTADLNHLVSEVAAPATVQRCTTVSQVSYCLYPGFGSLLPSLEAPVNAVLTRLPARPAKPLTIRQVVYLSLPDSALTHGHPDQEVARWTAWVSRAPGNASAAPASVIYVPVGSLPATGGQLADAHFDLALIAAWWAVRIPPQASGSAGAQDFTPCVPADQAREAIAIWLAILATRPSASQLEGGFGSRGISGAVVGHAFVRTWNYPGGGHVTPPGGGPQTTAAGYLLASAMTSLPEQEVSHVLAGGWARWLNWHTTDAQLAAALGLRMPSGSAATPPPGPFDGAQSPLCTN